MPAFDPGLVHTPVTPFTRERAVDFDRFGKLIEFHIGHGADALALPMHAGESVSLPDGERRALLEFAIARVKGRLPVIAHVSETGSAIAAALARHAEAAGAAAVVATTPYYWTPPPVMLLKHFVEIGAAVTVPMLVYNAPEEMQGGRLTAELCRKLIERLPNFAGVVDLSLDHELPIEAQIDDAGKVRQPFDQLATELGGQPAPLHLLGRVVDEHRNRDRRADFNEMLQQHHRRRRPIVGSGRHDGGRPGRFGVARERGRDRAPGLADMGDDRPAPLDARNREFQQRTAFAVGEADGLARMHRQRQRVGTVADVEFDELTEAVEIDGAFARERSDRRVHKAWIKGGHEL